MSAPIRPPTVDPRARFDSTSQQWEHGDTDAEGRRCGTWRWWRADGSLIEISDSVAGNLHGVKTWYYEDGSVCFRERNENGNTLWRHCYRPKNATKEGHPFGQLDERICELEQTFTADGWTTSQVLRDADGREVALDLTPAPPRPAGVPQQAVFYNRPEMYSTTVSASSAEPGVQVVDEKTTPAFAYWEVGEWRFVEGEQQWRGISTAYDRDGKYVRVAYATPGATQAYVSSDGSSGDPTIAAALAHDERAVDALLALKAFSGPTAWLHAALLGLGELAARLAAAGSALFSSEESPRRRDAIASDAIWVPSMKRFVKADLESTVVKGEATIWKKNGSEERWRYVAGARATIIRTEDEHRVEEELVTTGPRRGEVAKQRRFVGDVCVAEQESRNDGETLARCFDVNGRWRGERRELNGTLLEEQWWVGQDLVGTVRAVPAPHDTPHETFEGSGVKGATTPGLDGKPFGPWQTGDGVADLTALGRARFTRIPKARLPHYARQVARLNDARTTAITDLLDLDWTSLEGWFSRGAELAFFLRAFASADEELATSAFWELRENVLHQSTISAAGAPLLTAMLRLLPRLAPELRAHTAELVCDAFNECRHVLAQMTSLDGTLASVIMRALPELNATVTAAASHKQQSYMAKVLAEVRERDKHVILARIAETSDAAKRSELLASLVESPNVEPADVVPLFDDPDALLRLTAAYVAAVRFKELAPPQVTGVLCSAIADCADCAPRVAAMGWAKLGIPTLLARALRYVAMSGVDRDGARAAVPALASLVTAVHGEQLAHFTHEMMGLVFGNCELPFAPGFRAWLDAIVNASLLEGPDAPEIAERCGAFGLPQGHAQLVSLVDRLKEASDPAKTLRDVMHGEA